MTPRQEHGRICNGVPSGTRPESEWQDLLTCICKSRLTRRGRVHAFGATRRPRFSLFGKVPALHDLSVLAIRSQRCSRALLTLIHGIFDRHSLPLPRLVLTPQATQTLVFQSLIPVSSRLPTRLSALRSAPPALFSAPVSMANNFQSIGEAFTNAYYGSFDTDRATLQHLYVRLPIHAFGDCRACRRP